MLSCCDQLMPGVTRYSVFAYQEWQVKCFGVSGVARKLFCGRPVKIKGQNKIWWSLMTILPPSAAIKSARILSVAITIDEWPGA